MTWANVRTAMQSDIDALAPANLKQGQGKNFYHSAAQQIDDISDDRCYLIRKNDAVRTDTPVNQPGDYLCEIEVMVRYIKSTSLADDEDRIADDGVQIIEAILLVDHTDFQCWVDLPKQVIDEDDNGNYIATVAGRCRYKG